MAYPCPLELPTGNLCDVTLCKICNTHLSYKSLCFFVSYLTSVRRLRICGKRRLSNRFRFSSRLLLKYKPHLYFCEYQPIACRGVTPSPHCQIEILFHWQMILKKLWETKACPSLIGVLKHPTKWASIVLFSDRPINQLYAIFKHWMIIVINKKVLYPMRFCKSTVTIKRKCRGAITSSDKQYIAIWIMSIDKCY